MLTSISAGRKLLSMKTKETPRPSTEDTPKTPRKKPSSYSDAMPISNIYTYSLFVTFAY